MWRILVTREIAEHWRDRRFVFALVVCTAVAASFAVLELPEWSQRQQAAGQDEVNRKGYVRDMLADHSFDAWSVQFLPLPVARIPSRLSPFAAGIEAAMDETVAVHGNPVRRRAAGGTGEVSP